jgi:hypothetical protein
MRGAWVIALLIGGWSVPVAGEDLAVVRVNTRGTAARPAAKFTATHLGNGVLLTCGHCCKAAGGIGSRLDVEILSVDNWRVYRTASATVSCYNEPADVGVLLFDNRQAMQSHCTLAPRDYLLDLGAPVLLYTWAPDGAQLRSVPTTITNINLFAGAPNLETKAAPVPGDSGAPLVLRGERLVIGVTTGADYWNRFGVHSGLQAIHDVLQRCPVRPPIGAIRTASGEVAPPPSVR